jgi:DsbC/DsbD-like thiol-disulfide interchange protein
MDRRLFISMLAGLPCVGTARAAAPWSAKFIMGDFAGTAYQAGLHIMLDKGWKTYWRNPGEAGIPPNITAVGDNLASLETEFPLPIRVKDESGEALGYHDTVVFPLQLTPKDVAKPLDVQLSSFFGVCAQVCTPAKFDGSVSFAPSSKPAPDAALISQWQDRVPKTGNIVSSAKMQDKILVLNLRHAVSDIFIEGPDKYYFRAPNINIDGTAATFIVDGLKTAGDLIGADLRITVNAIGQGLEQHITVA